MTAPLQRQTATTDLLSLRVEGHTIAPQPKIVELTPATLTDHDSTLTATVNAIRYLGAPNTPPEEDRPRLVTLKIEWPRG